jgi:hypothetical protein
MIKIISFFETIIELFVETSVVALATNKYAKIDSNINCNLLSELASYGANTNLTEEKNDEEDYRNCFDV